MKSGLLLRLAALAGAAKLAAAECPNACSGHGTCGAYDMCTCYPGYMANDCSERVCTFGLAHVDSPKGDLNMDNKLDYTPAVIAGSQVYKHGTSELFPIMTAVDDVTSIDNTAHYYMECSNKGLCDRATGTCACFVGYEGTSCQRAACPNGCSGHGVCKTNRELAADDHDNIYELWDADITMGCDCDAGYGSYDCSERICPHGIDPLFVDDENTARMPEWTIYFKDSDALTTSVEGTWRLRFYDVTGEDWVTSPIPFGATCLELIAELESIPNDVVAEGTVECVLVLDTINNLWKTYKLLFQGNPGAHKTPEIIVVDEAGNPTLKGSLDEAYEGLDFSVVYDTGVTGEFYDFFAQKCGVVIGVTDASGTEEYALVQTATASVGTMRALKECLGDSNGDMSDNVGVENWDYGGTTVDVGAVDAGNLEAVPGQYPHLVKLVDNTADSEFEGGIYTIMTYDDFDELFVLSAAVDAAKQYQVYATDGVLERVWFDTNSDGLFEMYDGPDVDTSHDEMGLARWDQYGDTLYTSRDFSCENAGTKDLDPVFYEDSSDNNCLEKGDFLVIPSFTTGVDSSIMTGDTEDGSTTLADTLTAALATKNSAGLYKIMKISVEDYTANSDVTEDRYQIKLDRPIFWDGSDVSTSLIYTTDGTTPETTQVGIRQFFRFTPNMESSNTYNWVAPCSNRGLCDQTTGLCTCFAGYTNENCDTQSALAV